MISTSMQPTYISTCSESTPISTSSKTCGLSTKSVSGCWSMISYQRENLGTWVQILNWIWWKLIKKESTLTLLLLMLSQIIFLIFWYHQLRILGGISLSILLQKELLQLQTQWEDNLIWLIWKLNLFLQSISKTIQ